MSKNDGLNIFYIFTLVDEFRLKIANFRQNFFLLLEAIFFFTFYVFFCFLRISLTALRVSFITVSLETA